MAQLAIKYVLGHVGVAVVIPGAKNRTQLEQNFSTGPLPPLMRDELKAIEVALAG
jgi:aryl-alcohol dehydrogenase-like predicted oxidoreductase